MTPAVIFSLASLALFSLADLRYRVVPGAAIFFLASVLFAAPADPLRVGWVILAVGWGWLDWPLWLALPLLCSPATWGVLLVGMGTRRGLLGRADLLVLGGLACLFGWPGTLMALAGMEVWRRWWQRQYPGRVPALPGMLIGLAIYSLWSLLAP